MDVHRGQEMSFLMLLMHGLSPTAVMIYLGRIDVVLTGGKG